MIQKVAIQRQRSVEVPEVQYPKRIVDVPVATRRQSPVMLQRLVPTTKRSSENHEFDAGSAY